MQPARFRQEDILLVEINNAKSMSPALSSGRSAGSFPEQRLVIEPRFLSSTTKFVPAGLGRAQKRGRLCRHLYLINLSSCFCLFLPDCRSSAWSLAFNMAMIASATGVSGKRKEIYKYDAPWTIYGMNWSVRPDKRFRLALGSFVEEYNNKVCI